MSSVKESVKYQTMIKKVEKICADISKQDIDLDEMLGKVEEGYSLLKSMRGRLDQAKDKVDQLKAEYEPKDKEKD